MSENKQISTDEAVYRLVHYKSYRELFLAGEFSKLGLTDTSLFDLQTIDREQLSASAHRIARKLLSGNHQGGRGLINIFEETFAAWNIQSKKDGLDLVFKFLESTSFAKYHELSFVGKGYCIEQSFYEFIKQTLWDDGNPIEGIVRNEFLVSLFKTLSSTKDPNFFLDSRYVKKNSVAMYSVQLYQYKLIGDFIEKMPHFVLYASTEGQFISGEITALIADILFDEQKSSFESMAEILNRHRVGIQTYFSTCNQLTRIGVLPHVV